MAMTTRRGGGRGPADTSEPKGPMPPKMMRSRGQLASVYAPGALFTFEGGKGACRAVAVLNADAKIGRTTEELIYEQIEEFIRSWVDRATSRTNGLQHTIDLAQAIDRSVVVGGQLSLAVGSFVFTEATQMGYEPFPLAFVCRRHGCGLHRECSSVNRAEEEARGFRDACPRGANGCADDWEQLDVVMAHWSGDVQPLTPTRLRWDATHGIQKRDTCVHCGGKKFYLKRPTSSFSDWHFECVTCKHGRQILVTDESTLRLLGDKLDASGAANPGGAADAADGGDGAAPPRERALGVEVNMEPISYRASPAYYVQSDRLLVFHDDRWIDLLKQNRASELLQFLGEQFGYPAAALTDAERERILRDKNRGQEWDDYRDTVEMLAEQRAQGNERRAAALAAAAAKFEEDWEANVFVRRDRGSASLRTRIDDRLEWVRRYDPIRMAVEHRTLEAETLLNDARTVDSKPGYANLRRLDPYLRPDADVLLPGQEPRMLAEVERRLGMLGIADMRLIRGLEVCEYSFGYSRTSSLPLVRREKGNTTVDMPVRLNLFDRVGSQGQHPVLCADQKNEAFYLRLDEAVVLRWLAANGMPVDLGNPEVKLGGKLIEDYLPFQRFLEPYGAGGRGVQRAAYPYVYTLLHTMAHQFIGIVSELSGLDLGSFGEHIFVPNLAFIVYRRGTTMDLGNLSSMWRNYTDVTLGNLVLHRMATRETLRCGSETVCTMRGGACPDCILIPENACLTRNELLSRSVLIGGGFPKWDQTQQEIVGFYDVATQAIPVAGAMAAE